MKSILPHAVSVAAAIGLTAACAPSQFTTATIYDTPAAFVRLELDRTVEKGREHSHPQSILPEQMAAVLAGIMIEEPLAKLPFYDDTSQPRRHRAFTEKEVGFFAPLLASALAQATPEEIVTFYESREVSGTVREVTSGGMFIQGEILRLRLANYRSHTHQSADIGVADTQDDRLTPLRSFAPQRGRLHFEPRSSIAPDPDQGLTRMFSWDRREVAVLYRSLPPLQVTPAQPQAVIRP
ncbi:MAG: hypothetical protein Q8N04_16220 [Nitrospira sp.]|nr:hypothetical protein [Nitrospira sp.]